VAGVNSNTSVTVAEGLGVVGGTDAEGLASVTGAGFRRRMCREGRPRRLARGAPFFILVWLSSLGLAEVGLYFLLV
jgi:hypothetical protein